MIGLRDESGRASRTVKTVAGTTTLIELSEELLDSGITLECVEVRAYEKGGKNG